MKSMPEAAIRVKVDPTNPGQFFACCGMLELADRLWGEAEGWFEKTVFRIRTASSTESALSDLLTAIGSAALEPVDIDDPGGSPLWLAPPFQLRIDWWQDVRSGGDRLKVWAGSMSSFRIARAMQHALRQPAMQCESLLDEGRVVYDPLEKGKKVEPFYFDSRRGANSLSLDVGFSADSLSMTTIAYPAVEFLCLVGLQRCRPRSTQLKRTFEYFTWGIPLESRLAPVASSGFLSQAKGCGYRFVNAFRTPQKKHKAFLPATLLMRR